MFIGVTMAENVIFLGAGASKSEDVPLQMNYLKCISL